MNSWFQFQYSKWKWVLWPFQIILENNCLQKGELVDSEKNYWAQWWSSTLPCSAGLATRTFSWLRGVIHSLMCFHERKQWQLEIKIKRDYPVLLTFLCFSFPFNFTPLIIEITTLPLWFYIYCLYQNHTMLVIQHW